MLTKVTEIDGVDVFVDGKGKFYATLDGKEIKRSSLAAITKLFKKLFKEKRDPLTVYRVGSWNKTLFKFNLVGFTSSGCPKIDLGGTQYKYDVDLYVLDDDQVKVFQDILDEQATLNYRWREAASELDEFKVTAKNFKEFMNRKRS